MTFLTRAYKRLVFHIANRLMGLHFGHNWVRFKAAYICTRCGRGTTGLPMQPFFDVCWRRMPSAKPVDDNTEEHWGTEETQ